jgi:hypothetical protein
MNDMWEALRVADWLERRGERQQHLDAARLLREQHEEIEELREANEALRRAAECYKRLKARAEIYDGHVCWGDVRLPAPIPDRSPFDAIDDAVLAGALTALEVKP